MYTADQLNKMNARGGYYSEQLDNQDQETKVYEEWNKEKLKV
jgi:hypothetical protein